MTPLKLAWILGVWLTPPLAAVLFLVAGTQPFTVVFWTRVLRETRTVISTIYQTGREDAGVDQPIQTRVRRVLLTPVEVPRAACHCFAAVLADETPATVEMRVWRGVFEDVHPAVEFVGATFMLFFVAVVVLWPPAIKPTANPILSGVWVVQGGLFVVAAVGDLARALLALSTR